MIPLANAKLEKPKKEDENDDAHMIFKMFIFHKMLKMNTIRPSRIKEKLFIFNYFSAKLFIITTHRAPT